MGRIKFLTAGESHGEFLTAIIEGMPSGLNLSEEDFIDDSRRRRSGSGRSERMRRESDDFDILSGIRNGKTTGAPIAIQIKNMVHEEWRHIMKEGNTEPLTVPRPGHADYAGYVKFDHSDIRDVIERASARETAVRCALGSVAKKFLREFNIRIISRLLCVHKIELNYKNRYPSSINIKSDLDKLSREADEKYAQIESTLLELKQQLIENGDSCGGAFQILAHKLPVGLGSYTQGFLRMDAKIAGSMMSIPSVKSVSIGAIDETSAHTGRTFADCILKSDEAVVRKSNRSGGIEGGMTNGEPLIINCRVKPVPTIRSPLSSIDLKTDLKAQSFYENADLWVVEACGVIAESLLALVLLDSILERYGGDSMSQVKNSFAKLNC